MPVGIVEFKKRFGKKAVDTADAEERYKVRLKAVGAKLRAGIERKDKAATDALAEIKLRTGKKDWHGAADVLDDIEPLLAVDTARAAKLRQDLAAQAQRAFAEATGKLPTTLKAVHDAVEQQIAADDYAEAGSQLEDFTDLIDDHLARMAVWKQRESSLEGTAEQIDLRKRTRPPDRPEAAEVTKAASDFYPQKGALAAAVRAGDLATAEGVWTNIKRINALLLANPDGATPDILKALYETRLAAAQKKRLEYWLPFADSADPLLAGHQPALRALKGHADNANTLYGEAKYQDALDALDLVMAALPGLAAAVKAQDSALGSQIGAFAKAVSVAITGKTVPASVPAMIDSAALNTAYKQRPTAQANQDYVKAVQLVSAYAPGFQTIWQEMQKLPPVPAPVSPKVGQFQQLIAGRDRAALTTALSTATLDDLALFRAQPGASKLLDDMVSVIGSKADSKEKRDFVQAAMKARFGLKEVSGGADGKGMSTKALPRMYKLFAKLPVEHTTDNDLITSVERVKKNDTSTHSSSKKKIVLKAGKTGSEGGNFDDTTLHEIAHGVDSKFTFMENNGKTRKFGGWRVETRDSVKKVAADELAFYSYFEAKNVARPLLEKYLDLVFSGSNPKTLQAQFATAKNPAVTSPAELKKHPAIVHVVAGQEAAKDDDDLKRDLTIAARKLIRDREPLKSMLSTIVEAIAFGKTADEAINQLLGSLTFAGAVPADEVWAEMAVHPAIDFAANVGIKNGTSGLWDQGDSGAGRYAVSGRVYQEAYPNDWVSYLLSARASKVCDYQFRHRMEWFAECYSRFFLNTLSPNHPLVPWLTEQKSAAPKGA